MNGRPVTNDEDREAMRMFVEEGLAQNNIVQYIGMDAYSNPGGKLPGYITCKFLRDNFAQVGGASSGGGGCCGCDGGARPGGSSNGSSNISLQGVPMEPISIMIRKLYKNNEKVCV